MPDFKAACSCPTSQGWLIGCTADKRKKCDLKCDLENTTMAKSFTAPATAPSGSASA